MALKSIHPRHRRKLCRKQKARHHRRYAKKHSTRNSNYRRWLDSQNAQLSGSWEDYFKLHEKEFMERQKKWEAKYNEYVAFRAKFPDKVIEWYIKNPDVCKELKRRAHARKRNLGFIPLNDWFPNCDGHHIDRVHVIYIPREIHHSIQHCVMTNQNMNVINNKVMVWLKNKDNGFKKTIPLNKRKASIVN